MPFLAPSSPARFLAADRGAVSADWLVMSAFAVGMALLAVAGMGDASHQVTGEVDAALVVKLQAPEDG